MENFEYKATHKGFENENFYAAYYMVNCDNLIIAYNLEKDGYWKDVNSQLNPFQVFPRVSELVEVK